MSLFFSLFSILFNFEKEIHFELMNQERESSVEILVSDSTLSFHLLHLIGNIMELQITFPCYNFSIWRIYFLHPVNYVLCFYILLLYTSKFPLMQITSSSLLFLENLPPEALFLEVSFVFTPS